MVVAEISLDHERELVQRARYDLEAFSTLYEIYLPKIYSLVGYKVQGSEELVEDLVREIFETVLRKLPTFEWRGVPFRSWLYQIARNHVIDHFRTQKNTSSLEELSQTQDFASQSDTSWEVEQQLERERLQAALSQLPERERELVELKFSFGYNNREIASMVEMSESNVGSIVHRSMKKLRKFFEQQSSQEHYHAT